MAGTGQAVRLLVAADRSATTFTAGLPDTTAATIRAHVETSIEPDALLSEFAVLAIEYFVERGAQARGR